MPNKNTTEDFHNEKEKVSCIKHYETIVIGAGQAGLTIGYYLKQNK